ncbi:MAG TPA: CAP domain-containing protein, partial [Baekduia sp.]|nr:CAP domain-containing protein [Baekduia sp.]
AQALQLSAEESRLIQLVSQYRQSRGLSPVVPYPNLMSEARWYAVDMARNDAFSVTHVDSLGRTIDQRFWDFGYPFPMALGQATSSGGITPEETFEQLRTSPMHDAIMRDNRFRLAGAGYARNEATDSKHFWVISFAKYRIPTKKPRTSARKASRTAKSRRAKAAGRR